MYQIRMFRAADAGGASSGTASSTAGADPAQGGAATTPPAQETPGTQPRTETETPPAKPSLSELLKDPAYLAEHERMLSAATTAATAEAARVAKLTAEERQTEELNKFNAERAKFERERLENEATKQLAALKLPVEFAGQLVGADATTTLANVQAFGTAFSAAVEKAVTERIKGDPPKTGASGSTGNAESEYKNSPYYGKGI